MYLPGNLNVLISSKKNIYLWSSYRCKFYANLRRFPQINNIWQSSRTLDTSCRLRLELGFMRWMGISINKAVEAKSDGIDKVVSIKLDRRLGRTRTTYKFRGWTTHLYKIFQPPQRHLLEGPCLVFSVRVYSSNVVRYRSTLTLPGPYLRTQENTVLKKPALINPGLIGSDSFCSVHQ